MEVFSDLSARHPGYSLKFGGEFAEFEETMSGIWKLFALGIFLIYIILGGQFASFIQPFIILYTIPFAFIGAIAGLVLIQSPFTIATNVWNRSTFRYCCQRRACSHQFYKQ